VQHFSSATRRTFQPPFTTVVVSSSYGSVTNPLQQVMVLPTQPYAPVTLSLTLLKQGSSTVSGGVSITAAPTQIKLATKDVLAMLAMDEYLKGNWPSNSFPRTATLALVDDTFFVVNGTNALLNVMDIMTLEYGDPQVTSGSRNVATGLASTTAGINRLANIVFNDTAINADFAPLFLDVAGLPVPADMQGHSLLPLLQGVHPPGWRTSFYYRYYHDPGDHNTRAHYGVRTETHKLIYFWKKDQWEGYDLVKDPHELNNICHDPGQSNTVAGLKTELYRLKKELKDDDQFANQQPPPGSD